MGYFGAQNGNTHAVLSSSGTYGASRPTSYPPVTTQNSRTNGYHGWQSFPPPALTPPLGPQVSSPHVTGAIPPVGQAGMRNQEFLNIDPLLVARHPPTAPITTAPAPSPAPVPAPVPAPFFFTPSAAQAPEQLPLLLVRPALQGMPSQSRSANTPFPQAPPRPPPERILRPRRRSRLVEHPLSPSLLLDVYRLEEPLDPDHPEPTGLKDPNREMFLKSPSTREKGPSATETLRECGLDWEDPVRGNEYVYIIRWVLWWSKQLTLLWIVVLLSKDSLL
jgi:hypothetical protein